MNAFVIMPFDSEFDAVCETLIVPALNEEGFSVKRADTDINQQNILSDIIKGIDGADIIIAEITNLNPNVLYELGIAHGLQKPTILLTQDIQSVPFDLRSYRFIVYSTHFQKAKALKEQLQKIAKLHRDGQMTFGNPVSDFASSNKRLTEATSTVKAQGIANEGKHEEMALRNISEDLSEIQSEDIGFLDFILFGQLAIENANNHMMTIAEKTEGLTSKIVVRTAEFEHAKSIGNFKKVHEISKDVANDLKRYADLIDKEIPGLHLAWESLSNNFTNLFYSFAISDDDELTNAQTLNSTISSVRDVLVFSLENASSFREVISQLKGVSQELNKGSKRACQSLDAVIDELTNGEAHMSRLISLLDEKMSEFTRLNAT